MPTTLRGKHIWPKDLEVNTKVRERVVKTTQQRKEAQGFILLLGCRSCLPGQEGLTLGPGPQVVCVVWWWCQGSASMTHPLRTKRVPGALALWALCCFYICYCNQSLLPWQVCMTCSFTSAARLFGDWRIGHSSGQVGSLGWAGPPVATIFGLGRTKRHLRSMTKASL